MKVTPDDHLAVGIQLPIQSLSNNFAQPWEHDADVDDLVAVAEAADRAGLFYVAVCDHVAVPRDEATQMGTTWWDTVATLGLLAGRTSRVRLLSHVYVPHYRHPLAVAKAFATLDALSHGRVILGVGAGHVAGEFDALGVEHSARGVLLDEAIDAVDVALRDEFPEVDGATWSFRDAGVAPRPLQRPRPPIWVGGSSPAALRRTGRRGDGWLPQGMPLPELADAYAAIRDAADAAGRAQEPLDLGANGPWIHLGDPPPEIEGDRRYVTGEPERVTRILRKWIEAGADHVQVGFTASRSTQEYVEQVERFGAEVLPGLTR